MVEVLGKESAQAIGKVADASSNAVDAGRQFGQWFAKYCGHPLEQGMGLWGDKFYYRRVDNLLAFMENTGNKIKALQLEEVLRPLEMKIGIPLLEAVSLENNNYLRKLWENLLVNSVDNNSNLTHPAFIQVLQNLQPEEAKLLNYAYEQVGDNSSIIKLESDNFESSYEMDKLLFAYAIKADILDPQTEDVLAWFDNLFRLKLLQQENIHSSSYKEEHGDRYGVHGPSVETTYYSDIHISSFGLNFLSAINHE